MAEKNEKAEPADGTAPAKKRSKMPMILGLALALAGGGGGFFAVKAGFLFGNPDDAEQTQAPEIEALPDIAFVPVDPLIISLDSTSGSRHLRFTAQLEVNKAHEAEVQLILPRVMDVLNGYLRAVDVAELEKPSALVKLRAQMIRRIQIVAGEGRVRDVLVTEFVIN